MVLFIVMKTLITIVAGLLFTALIVSSISWITGFTTGGDESRDFAHEFFINGSSSEDLNFAYDLGIFSTEISEATEVNFNTVSFITSDTGINWVIAATEDLCSGECEPTTPSIRLPDMINVVDNTKTPLTVTINDTQHEYQIVSIGFELYVESEPDEEGEVDIVSNRAQRYSNGIGRVVLDKSEAPEDCQALTRIQIEDLVTGSGVTLAESEYPGINDTLLDDQVILIVADGRTANDLLTVDADTQCSVFIDTANLIQVGPQAHNQ